MNKLTIKEKKAYIKEGAGNCPKCHSGSITGDSVQIDESEAVQELTCDECSFSWRDIYILKRIEVIE